MFGEANTGPTPEWAIAVHKGMEHYGIPKAPANDGEITCENPWKVRP